MVEWLASHRIVYTSYLTLLGVAGCVVVYIAFAGLLAWIETRNTPKTDFFTCDRHGTFPVKSLILIDLGDGRHPVQQCPFCYDAAFKLADQRLKDEEAKRGAVPKLQ